MNAWPSLHKPGSLSPDPTIDTARRSWGGMSSAAHIISVCSQFALPSPSLHMQGLGFGRFPLAFTLLSHHGYGSVLFFCLSHAPFISCLFFFSAFASY